LTKGRIAEGGFYTGDKIICDKDLSAACSPLRQWRCDAVIDFFAAYL